MNIRCLTLPILLLALPFCLALRGRAQSSSMQNSAPPAALVTPSIANSPVEPSAEEMRAMSVQALDEMGDRLRGAKDYLGALDCYRTAIQKHPDAMYYNKVAISELMLHHSEEAATAAKKAVRKNKKMAEAWNNLGVAYYMGSHFQSAIRTYQRAISLQPDTASFHNNLAAALMDNHEFQKGLAEYRRAFELDPEFFEHSSMNGISARMGSPKDRAQFSYVMARLFASAGDTERALHFLRAALEDGYSKIDDVYKDKEFAGLLTDERFVELMKDRPVAVR
jgi:tetratricopeptide (TPR) repeat protein